MMDAAAIPMMASVVKLKAGVVSPALDGLLKFWVFETEKGFVVYKISWLAAVVKRVKLIIVLIGVIEEFFILETNGARERIEKEPINLSVHKIWGITY